MEDDLVKRLRVRAEKHLAATPKSLLISAADRIDELESKNLDLFQRMTLAEEWRDHDRDRAIKAEANLVEAVRDAVIKGMHIALTTPIEQVPEAIAAVVAQIKGAPQ